MPSTTFNAFNLHPDLLATLTSLSYKTPTPIQKESLTDTLLGKDLMGLAQTGTGKTLAFLLPIFQRMMDGSRGHIRALIMSPTRELAQQTHDAIGLFAKSLKLRSISLYGGVSMSPQIKNLRQADIVVACPGRLLDHVRQRTIDLSKVEVLVLDEADHMFDVGFLPDVRQILQQLPKKRQSLLFSATMPGEVRQLANDILKNPVTVQINNTVPLKSITQALYPVSQGLKTDLLIKLLKTHQIYSGLVFTRTKHRAKRVAEQLVTAGYTATSLQGNLSQSKRQSALNNFRSGKLQILVATDIASRGIDIASISHVFNYDMPDTVEAYTHRIGRTGRAAKLGDAFTLLAREDASKLYALERALGVKIEQRILPDFDYKAAGQAGAMRDESPRHNTRRPADSQARRPSSSAGAGNRRFAAAEFGQQDRTPGRGRARSFSSEHSQGDRPASRGNHYPGASANRTASTRPTSHNRSGTPASYGERTVSRNRFQGPSDHNQSERPAPSRRPQGAPGAYGERTPSRGRSPGFADRTTSDRPASRRPQSGTSSYGERPASRNRFQGPSDYNQSDRPAPSRRPQSAPGTYGERTPNRGRSPGFSDRSASDRPASRRPQTSSSYGAKPTTAARTYSPANSSDRPASRGRTQASGYERGQGARPASRSGNTQATFKPGPKRTYARRATEEKPKHTEE